MTLAAIALGASLLHGARIGLAPAAVTRVGTATERTEAIVTAVSAAWFRSQWRSYAGRFVSADGRVVDDANGGVSHSEGQGYGLLLAAKAGDQPLFDLLWRWTKAHLLTRQDGLAAWRWDPAAGTVTDANNATDGDVLLAWALWEGARRFGRNDYRAAAERLAEAVGRIAVRSGGMGPILLPAASGFGAGEQPDGPVFNLSYWVFPALTALKNLAPGTDWDGLWANGFALLEASRFGAFGLPTEWESLAAGAPRPASNFRAEFGYNAIRIPLYLALDGSIAAKRALKPFGERLPDRPWIRAPVGDAAPITVPLDAPGYNLVLALARCVSAGKAIPPDMIKTSGHLYFPETLRLLCIVAILERSPECL